jgi:acyl-CoA synthetase (AMP-forming)/AMP-acid ligase II
MIQEHSLRRAARYYPERTAIASGGTRQTFRELNDRVARIAAALKRHGFEPGERLAILLPNGTEYIELVYACSWLGVIAVPLNTRLSTVEMDRVLADASPRGLIRHSSLPVPNLRPSWQLVLDQQLLDVAIPVLTPFATRARCWLSSTRAARPGIRRALCRRTQTS